VSEETLAWNTPKENDRRWKGFLDGIVDTGRQRRRGRAPDDRIVFKWNSDPDRSEIFKWQDENRWRLWRRLNETFKQYPSLYGELGLKRGVPRYNQDGRENGSRKKRRPASDTTFEVHSVRLARRARPDGTIATNSLIAVITQRQRVWLDKNEKQFFWFRGGATLIIDPTEDREKILYAIIKSGNSETRRDAQKDTIQNSNLSSLRALYFGAERGRVGAFGEPFAMTHGSRGDPDNG
jgi:hypothetical protein